MEREMSAVEAEVRATQEMLKREGFRDEVDILETHILMLRDTGMRSRMKYLIEEHGVRAEEAMIQNFEEVRSRFLQSSSDITKSKADDVEDLMRRIRGRLSGEARAGYFSSTENIENPVVILPRLLVSGIIEARENGAVAVITEEGTSLSHAAIIAKSFGLPVLRTRETDRLRELSGSTVVVKAKEAEIILHPDKEEISFDHSEEPVPETQETSPLSIWLNIFEEKGPPKDVTQDIQGVGLYRSEFMLSRHGSSFPSEDEQYGFYRTLFKEWKGYPVTIRTFDIGGDKPVPQLSLGRQENPFLGLRAHRLYYFHPEIFITQIKAILRAGVACDDLRILYPMVETVDQLLYVQELVERAVTEMKRDNISFSITYKQGILIEVPSVVWALEDIAERVDFLSVGTNDLLQYHFAVDRGNANVGSLYRPEHPSALRMLRRIAEVAEAFRTPVTLCGEIAADPRLVPLLLGLGFTHLSVDIHAVGDVLDAMSGGTPDEFRDLAGQALEAVTSEDVRILLDKSVGGDRDEPHTGKRYDYGIVDPVCKMSIDPENAYHTYTFRGVTHYFCSNDCLRRFRDSPQYYASSSE